MPQVDPDNNDPLGTLILAVLPFVLNDRAAGLRHGPTERWLDALAEDWARAHLPVPQCPAWGDR